MYFMKYSNLQNAGTMMLTFANIAGEDVGPVANLLTVALWVGFWALVIFANNWVVVSNMCLFSSLFGEMILFDEHIFQMG